MNSPLSRFAVRTLPLLLATGIGACSAATLAPSRDAFTLPGPALDMPAATDGTQVAVLAGGCFWGLEAVFQHVKGVKNVVSGYSGGAKDTATYGQVSDGDTGHAESVRITYNPKKVSYGQLLKVYFSVAHNPTELNRQGPDTGTQYRSEIFYSSPQQEKVADAYIKQLTTAKVYPAPIVTQVQPLKAFYPAESYHQNYASLHPNNPYIVYNDAPKVTNLKQMLPTLYQPEQSVVQVQLH